MTEHEIYPNAPLVLVAVEVRFPGASAPASNMPMALQRSFRDRLGEDWVIESMQTQQISFAFGPEGPAEQQIKSVTVPRFTVRDRTLSIAITQESLTIETTNYLHYPQFRKVLERAFFLAAEILQPDGVARVGMRFIDELRFPGIAEKGSGDWKNWLPQSLLPPAMETMAKQGVDARGWSGLAQYRVEPERYLVLRYGVSDTSAVNVLGPLKLPAAASGPQFTLDFDCF